MNNLTPIRVTYYFDYGSMSQDRVFVTREHFDSLREKVKPFEEQIKSLMATITEKSDKDATKLVINQVKKLEKEIKKVIPPYTFVVEDSDVGLAMLNAGEGNKGDVIIPYNDRPKCTVKYESVNK